MGNKEQGRVDYLVSEIEEAEAAIYYHENKLDESNETLAELNIDYKVAIKDLERAMSKIGTDAYREMREHQGQGRLPIAE